jgi:MFS family permease
MVADEPRRVPAPWKLGLLASLYFAQGLPFGFQSNALRLYLTELGLAMTQVGFAGLLAAPWGLKFLWAPLVDRFGAPRFGRRKSWIVPAQALLGATCLVAGFVPPQEHLALVLALVLLMNFFAATQDIAVDGLAVDLLEPAELGAGNAAQVVGYKVGMLTGGSALVTVSAALGGWRGLFVAMAALCFAVLGVVLLVREPGTASEPPSAPTWLELFARVREVCRTPGVGWLVLAVATYKVGESMADAMFGPYLVRAHGMDKETVALWLGGWGTAASLGGSLGGGLLASRMKLLRAVQVAAALRVGPLWAQWLLSAGLLAPAKAAIISVTVAEHFFGGVLTTTMFSLMMSQVNRRIGATHFTVLAAVELWGKAPAGAVSGLLVDRFGFSPVFLTAVVLSGLYAVLLVPLEPKLASPPGGPAAASAP